MSPLVIAVRACISLLFNPKRYSERDIRTIAVLQPAKMGDMVCTTPLFRAIKKHLPHVRVVVLGDAINRAVLEGNQDVDRYIVCTESTFLNAVEELRSEHVDVGLVATPTALGISLFALSGAGAIVAPKIENGWSPHETKTYRLLRFFVTAAPHRMRHYAPSEYLRLLEPIGIHEDNTDKHLVVSSAARTRAAELLSHIPTGTKIVGIAASAGNKAKQWPPERFARVAEHIARTYGAHIVLTGSARDRVPVMALAGALPASVPVTNLLEKLSVEELKAVIQTLDLFVALDTGPIYIAEALGIPTVDIVGPVDPNEQPPQGPFHLVVTPPEPYTPATYVMNSRSYDKELAERLNLSITPEVVIAAVDTLMAKR